MSNDGGFNPGEHDNKQREDVEYLRERGTYMLGIIGVRGHGRTSKGSRWTKVRMKVLHGPQAGKVFDEKIFRTNASQDRLARYCKAMRRTTAFYPFPDPRIGISEERSDAEMDLRFFGGMLKASVTVKQGSQNSDMLFPEVKWPEKDLSENEVAFLEKCEAKFMEQNEDAVKALRAKLDDIIHGRGTSSSSSSSDDGYGGDDRSAFRDDEWDDSEIPF